MAATIKPMVTDGPALLAAAAAVRTNKPAPIIAPIPSATRLAALRVLFRPLSPSDESRISLPIGFLVKMPMYII